MTRLLPCIFLFMVGACGGSGGIPAAREEAGPQPFTFSGAFHVVGESGARTALFGSGLADADGAYAGTLSTNELGVVTASPLLYEAQYSTLPDGSLLWGSTTTGEAGLGGMTPDGRVAAWWWVPRSTSTGGLSLLLRREGLFDQASLEGTYRFVALTVAPSSGSVSSAGGTLVFDGLGGVTIVLEFVNDEGVLGPGGTISASYTVSDAGEVELDAGTTVLIGGVGKDGELVVLGGGRDEVSPPFVMHAVRQGTGRTVSALNGCYTGVLHRIQPVTHDELGKVGLLEAEGAGSAAWTPLYPDVANGRPRVPLPTTYTVSPEGQLNIVLEGQHYRGALSASGDVALLVGGSTDGEDPALLAFVRKRVLPPSDEIGIDLVQSASIGERPGVRVAGEPDTLDVVLTHRRLVVGEERPLGLGGTQGVRAVLRFDLGALRPGASLRSATLVTRQDEVLGSPFSALGDLEVHHVDLGSSIRRSDYDPPRRPLGTLGVLSSSVAPGTRPLDVTDAVLADLADGRSTADFLLSFSIDENGDDEIDRVVLDENLGAGPSLGPRTRLVLTYE